MFRRVLKSLIGTACVILALATILAGVVIIRGVIDASSHTSPKANTYITPPTDGPEDTPSADAPSDTPPQVADALAPYSAVALDTTGFDRPAFVQGWQLGEKHDYVTVTIGLSQKDWLAIASQLHLDPATDPSRLQLDQTTASSLIDINELAAEVIKNCQQYHVPVVDIRQLHEGYYTLTVVN